jgi:hypothetical protein
VLLCDARCQNRTVIYEDTERLARITALERNWQTVLRTDEYGTTVTWLCPDHRLAARIEVTQFEDHEEWCPRRTRLGMCCCSVSRLGPHAGDDAYNEIDMFHGVHTVRVRRDLL